MNKEQFLKEIEKLNLNLTDEMLKKLERYYQILISENAKYNLTTITIKEQVYLKHFYDSLTVTKIIDLSDESLCDIGTGAGFPGLVLKIAFPNLKLTLIDATAKKCEFLKKVVKELDLKCVEVIHCRAEEYAHKKREQYDIITTRAVAPLTHLLEYSTPLLKVNGHLVTMKANLESELKDLNNYLDKLHLEKKEHIKFQLPVENSHRELICFEKKAPTPLKYPRRYSEIKKRNL